MQSFRICSHCSSFRYQSRDQLYGHLKNCSASTLPRNNVDISPIFVDYDEMHDIILQQTQDVIIDAFISKDKNFDDNTIDTIIAGAKEYLQRYH